MLGLIDPALVGNRERKILAQSRTMRMNLSLSFSNKKHLKRMFAKAFTCSALLVLPACGIPNLRPPEPGPCMPPGFPAGFNEEGNPENSAQLGIDQFFNDPVLAQLIDQAVVGNLELKIMTEEVRIAGNDILARQGAYLPFATFGFSGGLDKPSLYTPLGAAEKQLFTPQGKHFPDPLPNMQLGLNVFWQIDVWRELRNARDAAAQRYRAALERRNYFVTRLVAEIAENYYRLMALDKRLDNLNQTIELQQKSLEMSKAKKEAGRGTELAVQRFQAEVRKNQSEKLIINQDIIEVENRINFLLNRYPQAVERNSAGFFDLHMRALSVGIPSQLLLNRPDIRQAERELAAAGLDVRVARAHFLPRVDITGGVGYQAYNPRYLFFTPDALIANVAGNLIVPVINKKAIQAEYLSANARQLESLYNYQRLILNAFTEVVNRMSKVDNYGKSIEIKKQQLESLEASVESATKLFQNARAEYMDVLFSQRDLMDARMVLIDTKKEQLSAVVNAYQALGGGDLLQGTAPEQPLPPRPFRDWLHRCWHGDSPKPVMVSQATPEMQAPAAAPEMAPAPRELPPAAKPNPAAPAKE
jgi:multidrug efflux system outer membrane protein